MNLYKSFGDLMEAWVTERNLNPEPEWLGNHDEDSVASSSDMGTNLRSESVDSGVETPSSDTSFPATSCSISTDNADIDTFTPTSTSRSPFLSSSVPPSSSHSSPHICPSRAQDGSTALHLKVEQALQRTDSKQLKDNPEPVTVDKMLRRRPRASFLSKQHTSNLVRGQRSQSLGPRRTINSSMPFRQMSEIHRRPLSMCCDKQAAQTRSEDLGEEAGTGLSPGLNYLEQVCQMLEEIARQQMMYNCALHMEMDALQEHQDTQAPDTCQGDSKALEENISSCQRLENEGEEQVSCEPQQQKKYPHRHVRQRSASCTSIETLRSRKLRADFKEQQLSTDDLMKKSEEDCEKQECKKGEMNKMSKNWKFKIGSLKRDDSGLRETKSQQMQSSEKNSTRRRLSKLFRRRRKTLPA